MIFRNKLTQILAELLSKKNMMRESSLSTEVGNEQMKQSINYISNRAGGVELLRIKNKNMWKRILER